MNSTSSDLINFQPDRFTFTVPITVAYHQIAEQFYQQHSDPQKAQQVYLNTLSVQAVQFYLTCLGVKTSLEQSQSWNTALQVLADTADLWVENLGPLECRPMLSNRETCFVPAQVWSDRIGYVVVQFNPDLTEATLLGFVATVEIENIQLEELQSLDRLPEYLEQLAAEPAAIPLGSTQPSPTQSGSIQPVASQPKYPVLSQWLHHFIETGWQTIERLMEEMQSQPALSFRTPMTSLLLDESATGVKRGKFLVFKSTPDVQVLFLIEIVPQSESEYQLRVELYPTGKEAYLPRSLQVSVLDEAGKTVLQAKNSNSEGLEFQFSGETGEHFSVSMSLDGYNIVETFEV